jgi:hypothetical protein
LITACSRAATPNECITSDARSADPPLGVAIVRRDGDRARIEVGLRNVSSAEWSTRDLVFQPDDDELERYRAIGFTIGTLVSAQVPPPEPASPSKAATEPPRAPQPAATETDGRASPPAWRLTTPPQRARATWLDVAGGVGLGLVPGSPRVGVALRAASELAPSGFFGVGEVGYAERPGDASLRVRWLSLALGVGHPLVPRLRALRLDARLLFVLERMSLAVVEDERADGTARWKPGLGGAIDAYWEASPPLGLVVSAVTHVDPARTAVRVEGDQAGETPAVGLGGFIGLRLKVR